MPARLHFGEIVIPLGATPEGVEKAISEAGRLREIVQRHGGTMDEGQSVKALLHIRGFDEWEQLCISLSDPESADALRKACEPTPSTPVIAHMSYAEISMRIKDHAIDMQHTTDIARKAQRLAEEAILDLRAPESTRALDVGKVIVQARVLGSGDAWSHAFASLNTVLNYRDINEVRPAGKPLDIEPSEKHPPAGRSWLPFDHLGTSPKTTMGPMAFIGRKDDDAVPMLRMLQARGHQCYWVGPEAPMSHYLQRLVADYTGFRSDEPFRSAVDYIRMAVFHWDEAHALGHRRPPPPPRRATISVPWYPHDDLTASYLEPAYRAGIDLVVRLAPADHRRAARAYAKELIRKSRYLALGPRTVLPDYCRMPIVANHTLGAVFRKAPAGR